MLELTHDDQKGREPNPNAKKGKNNKEKLVDLFNAMENGVVRGEIAIAKIKEHLEIFKQKMDEVDDLREQMGDLSQDVVVQRQSLEEFQVMVMNSIEALRAQVEELHEGLEETKSDWALCKKAMVNGVLNTNAAPPMRVKVPRQMRYGGKLDAQEIENFLWSMERYFEATNV